MYNVSGKHKYCARTSESQVTQRLPPPHSRLEQYQLNNALGGPKQNKWRLDSTWSFHPMATSIIATSSTIMLPILHLPPLPVPLLPPLLLINVHLFSFLFPPLRILPSLIFVNLCIPLLFLFPFFLPSSSYSSSSSSPLSIHLLPPLIFLLLFFLPSSFYSSSSSPHLPIPLRPPPISIPLLPPLLSYSSSFIHSASYSSSSSLLLIINHLFFYLFPASFYSSTSFPTLHHRAGASSRSVHVASPVRFQYLQFYYHLHTNRRRCFQERETPVRVTMKGPFQGRL